MQVYYVHPLAHAEGMLIAYLPRERLLFEADLFDSHAAEAVARQRRHAQPRDRRADAQAGRVARSCRSTASRLRGASSSAIKMSATKARKHKCTKKAAGLRLE